ncbi:proline-rich acidic protein 1 [Chroicocephalus ridibundus]|uniref:proline-rich acidic protein 1 n=1 Tax=Chroicocephalus ridibundus TaxID=1192867 RepID=UPI002FDE6ABD
MPWEETHPPAGKVRGKGWGSPRMAAMERPAAVRLCSIALLLGTALLLPAPGGTQAPSGTGRKDLAAEQDLAKEILLGIRAVEPPEEHEITDDVELGLKVSSSAWAQRGPLQVQAGPEEDHDHLHHPPQDNAGEANAHRPPPRMLSLEVQSVPEEDRDHLHHG